MGATRMDPADLQLLLDDRAGVLLERHLERDKEWFPHELIPAELGCSCSAGQAERAERPALSDGVRSALFVNLLTEDNLPHYYHAISETFRTCGALGEWSRRWTAEEQRHGIVMRDWISRTRPLDLVDLERARMHQVSSGFDTSVKDATLVDGLVYLAFQELATRISHWNTGRFLDDVGTAVMKRVAADENKHYLFYRDMATAALQADPSTTVVAIDRQVTSFQMPGTRIQDFNRHARAIADAGIYDFQIHHDQVLAPHVFNHWRIDELEGLDEEAEQARDHLLKHLARMKRVAARMDAAAERG